MDGWYSADFVPQLQRLGRSMQVFGPELQVGLLFEGVLRVLVLVWGRRQGFVGGAE